MQPGNAGSGCRSSVQRRILKKSSESLANFSAATRVGNGPKYCELVLRPEMRVVTVARGYGLSRISLTSGAKRNRNRASYVFGNSRRMVLYRSSEASKSEPVAVQIGRAHV